MGEVIIVTASAWRAGSECGAYQVPYNMWQHFERLSYVQRLSCVIQTAHVTDEASPFGFRGMWQPIRSQYGYTA